MHYKASCWSEIDRKGINKTFLFVKFKKRFSPFYSKSFPPPWFTPLCVCVFVFLCVCCCAGKGEQSYPDLLALLIALVVTVIVALGVKNSVGFNNVLNVINLLVWVFMMIAGLFFVNGDNWDEGRFLPYGWSGVGARAHAHTHVRACVRAHAQIMCVSVMTSEMYFWSLYNTDHQTLTVWWSDCVVV